jgi:hypothetical protein
VSVFGVSLGAGVARIAESFRSASEVFRVRSVVAVGLPASVGGGVTPSVRRRAVRSVGAGVGLVIGSATPPVLDPETLSELPGTLSAPRPIGSATLTVGLDGVSVRVIVGLARLVSGVATTGVEDLVIGDAISFEVRSTEVEIFASGRLIVFGVSAVVRFLDADGAMLGRLGVIGEAIASRGTLGVT